METGRPTAATKLRSDAPKVTKRSQQAQRTRGRILQTAIKFFARKGYDGVSIDELVAKARVNKRMVYHYFGNKDGLYSEALACMYRKLAEVELDVLKGKPSTSEALERIVRAYFRFLQETPEFVSILLWENLQDGRHLDKISSEITKAPILEQLDAVIAQGLESGELRKGIDRHHLLINLIGLCLVYFSNRHTLSKSTGIPLDNPRTIEAGITHAISLVRFGCLNH